MPQEGRCSILCLMSIIEGPTTGPMMYPLLLSILHLLDTLHCVEMLPASRCCRILSGESGVEAQPPGCLGSTQGARLSFQILVVWTIPWKESRLEHSFVQSPGTCPGPCFCWCGIAQSKARAFARALCNTDLALCNTARYPIGWPATSPLEDALS